MRNHPTNPKKSEKYNHRSAGTEAFEKQASPRQKTEEEKRLDEVIESGKRDIPFPGDGALDPEGI